MSSVSLPESRRTRRGLAAAVAALAVTACCGLFALASLASSALNDTPVPGTGWLTAGFYAQIGLGACAVILFIASLVLAKGQRVVARLGWAVTTMSVASIALTTLLARTA